MLVTHSMSDVRTLCDRVILLDKGKVIKDGLPDEVVDYYNALIAEKENSKLSISQRRERDGWLLTEYGTKEAHVESVRLLDAQTGAEIEMVTVGQELIIETKVAVLAEIPRLILGHRITDRTGHIVWGTNTWHTKQAIENLTSGNTVTFRARFKCTLGPGSYSVSFGLVSSDTHLENCYHKADNPLVFDVMNVDQPLFVGSSWLNASFDIHVETSTSTVPLRIAVISTPRSGNTWQRYLLADIYNAQQIAVHTPNYIDWESLPQGNLILQLHWHRTPEFVRTLRQYGFKVVVLQRHPLDVLLSILQFASYEPQTARWLDGEAGDESFIYGCKPTSPEFLCYATGPRSRALLSVSAEWCRDPEAIVLRYEDVVKDTQIAMTNLIARLGPPCADLLDVINKNTLNALRRTTTNGHFWQGSPGLWRELLPVDIALDIASVHRKVFDELGYECNPDKTLQNNEADMKWAALCQ